MPSAVKDMLSEPAPGHHLEQLPPEIAQVTSNYQPLSKLFERVAQECYTGLSETITSLREVRDHTHLNGGPSINAATISPASAEKRVQWLNFADKQKDRFLKLWVMLQWSRHVGEISKTIDVFAWMNQQEAMFNNADDMMGRMKRELHPEKIPNPDIETALEILSNGQTSRMPDVCHMQSMS